MKTAKVTKYRGITCPTILVSREVMKAVIYQNPRERNGIIPGKIYNQLKFVCEAN